MPSKITDKLYVLDEHGQPRPAQSLTEWLAWFETAPRTLRLDKIGDSEVSTTFIGMNLNHVDGPPLLYETMIFGGQHNCWCRRYQTREEAIDGHVAAIALAAAKW